jgi:hypothetical protein
MVRSLRKLNALRIAKPDHQDRKHMSIAEGVEKHKIILLTYIYYFFFLKGVSGEIKTSRS